MGVFPEISCWEKDKTSTGKLVFWKEISPGTHNLSVTYNLTRSDKVVSKVGGTTP